MEKIGRPGRESGPPPPAGDFPPVRRAGRTLHFSGIGHRDTMTNQCAGIISYDDAGQVLEYDFNQAWNRAMDNVELTLDELGLPFDTIVNIDVLLKNKADWATANDLWTQRFQEVPLHRRPTRTTAVYNDLPLHNQLELKPIGYLSIFQFLRLLLQRKLP